MTCLFNPLCSTPRFFVTFRNKFLYGDKLLDPLQALTWRITTCRLSATAFCPSHREAASSIRNPRTFHALVTRDPRNRGLAPIEKLIVAQLLKKFLIFSRIRKSITVFTKSRNWSESCPNSLTSVLILFPLLCLDYPNAQFFYQLGALSSLFHACFIFLIMLILTKSAMVFKEPALSKKGLALRVSTLKRCPAIQVRLRTARYIHTMRRVS